LLPERLYRSQESGGLKTPSVEAESLVALDSNLDSAIKAVLGSDKVSSVGLDTINDTKGNGLQQLARFKEGVSSSEVTYVNNALKRAENGSDRLSNEGNSREEASLANQDVEQDLVDTDKLAEGVEDGVSTRPGGDGSHAPHGLDVIGDKGDDLREALDDLLVGSQSFILYR
jgi:hypothetical protein